MNHIAQYRNGLQHQIHHNHCPPLQNFTARFHNPNIPDNVNSVMIPQIVNEGGLQYHSAPLPPFLQPPSENRHTADNNVLALSEIQRKQQQQVNDNRNFQTIPTADRQDPPQRPPENSHQPQTTSPPVDNRRYVQHCNQGAKNCVQCYNNSASQKTQTGSIVKVMVDASTMTDQDEMDQLANWPGITVQPGSKVAEYLTSLRQFLKVSIHKFSIFANKC